MLWKQFSFLTQYLLLPFKTAEFRSQNMLWSRVCDTVRLSNRLAIKADYFKNVKNAEKTILFCKAILLANVFKIPLNFVRKGSFDGTFRVILKSVYSSYIARCVFRVPQKIKITQDWFYVVKWSRNIQILRKKVGFGLWL